MNHTTRQAHRSINFKYVHENIWLLDCIESTLHFTRVHTVFSKSCQNKLLLYSGYHNFQNHKNKNQERVVKKRNCHLTIFFRYFSGVKLNSVSHIPTCILAPSFLTFFRPGRDIARTLCRKSG